MQGRFPQRASAAILQWPHEHEHEFRDVTTREDGAEQDVDPLDRPDRGDRSDDEGMLGDAEAGTEFAAVRHDQTLRVGAVFDDVTRARWEARSARCGAWSMRTRSDVIATPRPGGAMRASRARPHSMPTPQFVVARWSRKSPSRTPSVIVRPSGTGGLHSPVAEGGLRHTDDDRWTPTKSSIAAARRSCPWRHFCGRIAASCSSTT